MCVFISDLVIWKFKKSMVIHDTECPYWDQVSSNNTNPTLFLFHCVTLWLTLVLLLNLSVTLLLFLFRFDSFWSIWSPILRHILFSSVPPFSIFSLILCDFILRGDKVSMLTHIYPHKPWRNIEVTICKITRLTAHFMCGLMSDLLICTCL